jgi:Tfp pilus assembly protein PilF
LLARAGNTTQAKKSLNEALRLAPDRAIIRLFRAQSLAIMKEPDAAMTEWQKLLKSGQHEVAAHRGLALTCCSLSRPGGRYRKLALEHAKLAH